MALESPIGRRIAAGLDVVVEDLPAAGLAYLISRELRDHTLLLIAADEDAAESLSFNLRTLGADDVFVVPSETAVPFGASVPDSRLRFQQFALRHRICRSQRPRVVVTSASALQQRWMPDAVFENAMARWGVDEEVPLETIVGHLTRCGYHRMQVSQAADDVGTFSVRGSVVDIFPPNLQRPVRIDLFGDEIASIKAIDIETQRPVAALRSVEIFPIRDVVFDPTTTAHALKHFTALAEEESVPTKRMHEMRDEIERGNYFYGIESLWPLFYDGSATLLDTLLAGKPLVVLDQPADIEAALEERYQRADKERNRGRERNDLTLDPADHILSTSHIIERLKSHVQLRAERLVEGPTPECVEVGLGRWEELSREIKARRDDATRGEILDPLVETLQRLFAQGYEVFLPCSTRGHAERLRELLISRGMDLPILEHMPEIESLGAARRQPRRAVVQAGLTSGLADHEHHVAVITDVEIFGTPPPRRRQARQQAPADGLTTLRDLREDDLVIHVDHGIGRYLGLKRLVLDGVDGDYVHLDYSGGDKLYLPVYHLNLLQRYRGSKDARVDKLGGTRWERAKQRVRDAALNIAHGLLALQARRKALPGFALPEPDDHFRAFEATFPFEETEDQRTAIEKVLADMTADAPMDRLVCGDVGFGKTEVAVRGAFLAVSGGKQVAVLVPTTVLAEQHGHTFRERLSGQGLNIEVLSRFRTPQESKSIVAAVKSGKIDILVGTHRLLSADIHFSDLGLLVIDEEQRFGVKHKERIKELRSHVHVLTLSATPIPRTLHMAMMGLRDLSLIQTPPVDRTAIRTEVARFDEELVQQAIRREMHRGGQVFFVHNRVQSIDAMADRIRELVPEARLEVAHGQMTGSALEKIMVRFVRREIQVLVSTAIIESGIDIPTANTMLINRADMFGLSQLHQLRGRIGRGRDRAYAYLLLPRAERISKEATERLAVLKRFSDLGAGFQIASQDLDLRGAGDLLGAEQSGSITAVGFELYTELLGEAVEKARGQGARHVVEPDIKLPVSAVIPEDYVQQPMRRLDYYQRMAQAETDEKVFDIVGELEGVYGAAPPEVSNLAEVMVIRRRLQLLGALRLSGVIKDDEIRIGVVFLPEAPLDRVHLAECMQNEPERYRLTPSGTLAITVPTLPDTEDIFFLRRVRRELGELRCLA